MPQAQFSQMRPAVPMTPTLAPRLPMYPPMAPQQLFYGQAPPTMIPPQVTWKLYFNCYCDFSIIHKLIIVHFLTVFFDSSSFIAFLCYSFLSLFPAPMSFISSLPQLAWD
jgi:hypothetical protein